MITDHDEYLNITCITVISHYQRLIIKNQRVNIVIIKKSIVAHDTIGHQSHHSSWYAYNFIPSIKSFEVEQVVIKFLLEIYS